LNTLYGGDRSTVIKNRDILSFLGKTQTICRRDAQTTNTNYIRLIKIGNNISSIDNFGVSDPKSIGTFAASNNIASATFDEKAIVTAISVNGISVS
jgi:hypothetical protein